MKKFAICSLLFALCACVSDDAPYNQKDFASGGTAAPYYYQDAAATMAPDNQYADIDAYRPETQEEQQANAAKWNTSRKETTFQEYRGAMVRVEILTTPPELREMRLKLIRNADGADVNGDARHVLSQVSEFQMRRVCGRKAKYFTVVYDRPGFESIRPTPFFDYKINEDGPTIREYGFKCEY